MLRDAIGDNAALMFDANQRWNLATAIRMCRKLKSILHCGSRNLPIPMTFVAFDFGPRDCSRQDCRGRAYSEPNRV